MTNKATLDDFCNWVNRDLGRFMSVGQTVEVVERGATNLRIRVYTQGYSYSIVANSDASNPDLSGYLGCVATSRVALPGEKWTRGADLADGSLSEDTWRQILANIVAFELVPVQHHAQAPWAYAT